MLSCGVHGNWFTCCLTLMICAMINRRCILIYFLYHVNLYIYVFRLRLWLCHSKNNIVFFVITYYYFLMLIAIYYHHRSKCIYSFWFNNLLCIIQTYSLYLINVGLQFNSTEKSQDDEVERLIFFPTLFKVDTPIYVLLHRMSYYTELY